MCLSFVRMMISEGGTPGADSPQAGPSPLFFELKVVMFQDLEIPRVGPVGEGNK